MILRIAVVVSCLSLANCATLQKLTGDNSSATILDGARKNFDAGLLAYKNKRYAEAIQYFEHVKAKYPYSSFARQSDLQIAETYFIQSKWIDAAYSYNFYLRFHPNSDEAPYAAYKACLAFNNSRPSDFFLFPPSHKKDQTATYETLAAAENFLKNFKEAKYEKEVLGIKSDMLNLLTEHDLSIAKHYEKREKYLGALWRYEKILSEYPDSPKTPKILLAAAELSLGKLNKPEKAKYFLTQLVSKYKDELESKAAKSMLAKL